MAEDIDTTQFLLHTTAPRLSQIALYCSTVIQTKIKLNYQQKIYDTETGKLKQEKIQTQRLIHMLHMIHGQLCTLIHMSTENKAVFLCKILVSD